MNIKLETKRLMLREIDESDLDEMFSLDSNINVQKYIGNQIIIDKNEALNRIMCIQEQYRKYGIGRWAIVLKSTEKFIGWSGLKFMTDSTNNHINFHELGYRFLPEYWGFNYATEAAIAIIDYGWSELDLQSIYALTHFENIRSQKILEKVGFSYIEDFVYQTEIHKWYKINKK